MDCNLIKHMQQIWKLICVAPVLSFLCIPLIFVMAFFVFPFAGIRCLWIFTHPIFVLFLNMKINKYTEKNLLCLLCLTTPISECSWL